MNRLLICVLVFIAAVGCDGDSKSEALTTEALRLSAQPNSMKKALELAEKSIAINPYSFKTNLLLMSLHESIFLNDTKAQVYAERVCELSPSSIFAKNRSKFWDNTLSGKIEPLSVLLNDMRDCAHQQEEPMKTLWAMRFKDKVIKSGVTNFFVSMRRSIVTCMVRSIYIEQAKPIQANLFIRIEFSAENTSFFIITLELNDDIWQYAEHKQVKESDLDLFMRSAVKQTVEHRGTSETELE